MTALGSAYSFKPFLEEHCVASVVSSTHNVLLLGHSGSHMRQGLLLSRGLRLDPGLEGEGEARVS